MMFQSGSWNLFCFGFPKHSSCSLQGNILWSDAFNVTKTYLFREVSLRAKLSFSRTPWLHSQTHSHLEADQYNPILSSIRGPRALLKGSSVVVMRGKRCSCTVHTQIDPAGPGISLTTNIRMAISFFWKFNWETGVVQIITWNLALSYFDKLKYYKYLNVSLTV